ncbi:PREDICTED: glutathione S-transferase U13-like [Tarenaya hassleriana]|uniref:glutathione S-transferase U13-like n=1 Tax=Tarenaya hassleriana TaxID=28532 RepID=UPI00053C5960|nr:PREDICTED: glutathione S-transferase U13-like [Tarenaya hassleriana]
MAQDGSSGLKLIGTWSSPYAIRARTALHLKSVAYDYVEEKDVLSAKSDLLLKHNPIHKKVPVLVHGDRSVCESLNIVQYVDEAWPSPPSILPSDPYDRSIARFWAQYIDEQCFSAITATAGAKDDEGRMAAAANLGSCLAVLEEGFKKCSKGGDFFGGDNIGLVDIACGSLLGPLWVIQRFSGVQFLREDSTPSLVRWSERFCGHDAVKPYMPTVDEFVEFAKKKFNVQ